MALVRIEILRGRSAEEKRQLLAAVHDAVVAALQVPRGDPVLRIIEGRSQLVSAAGAQ